MGSPTQRTLALLKKEGFVAQVVEKWVFQAKKRIDLFGLIDVLAIQSGVTLGVQASTGDGVSSHIDKAMQEPRLWDWLDSKERRFEIWGWRKIGKKGKRKLWAVRRVIFLLVEGGVVHYEEKESVRGARR